MSCTDAAQVVSNIMQKRTSQLLGYATIIAVTALISHLAIAHLVTRTYTPHQTKKPVVLSIAPASVLGSCQDFLGNPTSPYTLVEFMDYQCPPCKRSYPVFLNILKYYPGKVRLTIRNFPLTRIHKFARPAAIAAEAAREQGRFWPMHDALAASDQLDGAQINLLAREQRLDMKRFARSCASTAKAAVEADEKQARMLHLEATPSFLLCTPQGQTIQIYSLGQLKGLMKNS